MGFSFSILRFTKIILVHVLSDVFFALDEIASCVNWNESI